MILHVKLITIAQFSQQLHTLSSGGHITKIYKFSKYLVIKDYLTIYSF